MAEYGLVSDLLLMVDGESWINIYDDGRISVKYHSLEAVQARSRTVRDMAGTLTVGRIRISALGIEVIDYTEHPANLRLALSAEDE